MNMQTWDMRECEYTAETNIKIIQHIYVYQVASRFMCVACRSVWYQATNTPGNQPHTIQSQTHIHANCVDSSRLMAPRGNYRAIYLFFFRRIHLPCFTCFTDRIGIRTRGVHIHMPCRWVRVSRCACVSCFILQFYFFSFVMVWWQSRARLFLTHNFKRCDDRT